MLKQGIRSCRLKADEGELRSGYSANFAPVALALAFQGGSLENEDEREELKYYPFGGYPPFLSPLRQMLSTDDDSVVVSFVLKRSLSLSWTLRLFWEDVSGK